MMLRSVLLAATLLLSAAEVAHAQCLAGFFATSTGSCLQCAAGFTFVEPHRPRSPARPPANHTAFPFPFSPFFLFFFPPPQVCGQ